MCAAKIDCGSDIGAKFEKAVEAIVRAWLADPYVVQNRPRMSNIQTFLEKRALKPKPVVKLVPAAPAPGSGEALLDWHDQIERSKTPEQRRQEEIAAGLIPRDKIADALAEYDRREAEKERLRAVGGAS